MAVVSPPLKPCQMAAAALQAAIPLNFRLHPASNFFDSGFEAIISFTQFSVLSVKSALYVPSSFCAPAES